MLIKSESGKIENHILIGRQSKKIENNILIDRKNNILIKDKVNR